MDGELESPDVPTPWAVDVHNHRDRNVVIPIAWLSGVGLAATTLNSGAPCYLWMIVNSILIGW
jgi:hypothetical protein